MFARKIRVEYDNAGTLTPAPIHWLNNPTQAKRRLEWAIRHTAFKKHSVATFFIGAAIETKMATEIWSLLQKGTIANAANLTDDDQIASISKWLCAL
jgi:hypothetical protein